VTKCKISNIAVTKHSIVTGIKLGYLSGYSGEAASGYSHEVALGDSRNAAFGTVLKGHF
jgi:hypothetical protein